LHGNGNNSTLSLTTFTALAPQSQSVAAVTKEEWEKHGIPLPKAVVVVEIEFFIVVDRGKK
jgi:hypothetical protein